MSQRTIFLISRVQFQYTANYRELCLRNKNFGYERKSDDTVIGIAIGVMQ